MLSNPMGLSYFDSSTGQNVLLAEVRDCPGELVEPNVIVFHDAFDTLKASIRYTYTKAGLEQDFLLHESPGPPGAYGLNAAFTTLETYTEIFASPEPVVRLNRAAEPPQDLDPTLDFGSMRMEQGAAYFLRREVEAVRVRKSWELLEGRRFLIERVPYREVATLLGQLQVRTPAFDAQTLARRTTLRREGLAGLVRPRGGSSPLASAARRPRFPKDECVVLDYVTLNSSQGNYVFRGDQTYYLTAKVLLYGTPRFEAGSVLKYQAPDPEDTDPWANSVWVNDDVDWQGAPYRPVVLTAKDDNSVGATISGSTGSPSGTYSTGALVFNYPNRGVSVEHVRVRNAVRGIWFSSALTQSVRHAQFVDNDYDIISWGRP